LIEEIVDLQNQNISMEQSLKDLEIELDAANMRALESEEHARTRENALQKAQSLIKKLNDECERTVKDLVTLEQNNELLKRNVRTIEKEMLTNAKEVNEVESYRKLEERLRVENVKLKDALSDAQGQAGVDLNFLQ
jgi:predicted  nucleic acid-binding Zn-ribbon protein